MCTTFTLKNERHIILAQGYDFYYGHGLVVVNTRGIEKVALCDDLTKDKLYDYQLKTPRWISKYGSVTFNQFARELPSCGVNEAGLAVTSMWHDTEKLYPDSSENSINELQWIQYQLDCCTNVNEVIDNLDTLTLRTEIYPLHYHISDKSGCSVIIEIENGKLRAFDNLDAFACSNEGVIKSIEYSKKYTNTAADKIEIKEPILDRAAKALLMTSAFNESQISCDPIDYSFNILDAVSLQVGFKALFKWIGKGIPPSQTFWQIAFDLGRMTIYFKTKSNRYTRFIDISAFDFAQGANTKVLGLDEAGEGDVTHSFGDYSRADNERIVKASFKPLKGAVSVSEQEELIVYPELLRSAGHVS